MRQVRETGLNVELSVLGEPRALPEGVGLCAYRIVQEALTNTLKHADASRAEVSLRYVADALRAPGARRRTRRARRSTERARGTG